MTFIQIMTFIDNNNIVLARNGSGGRCGSHSEGCTTKPTHSLERIENIAVP